MKTYQFTIYPAVAFFVTFLFMPVLIKLLSEWQVFDSPGKHKIHRRYVPSMGGICIALGAGFAQLIGLPFSEWSNLKFFYIAIAIMFITGIRDDILTLTPRQKLFGQLLPIILLVVFGDTVLSSFYGVAFDGMVFNEVVSYGVTIFTIVILTNAYNLIDGLDGLAGTVGSIALLFLGVWFALAGDISMSLICLSFFGALVAFLYFNWEPSKIFMGDTGALVVGLLLSFMAVRFINANFQLPDSSPIRFSASIGTAVAVLIIPIFDTLRVILLRLRNMQSPFHADKNHLHHQFLKMGFSHRKTVVVIGAIQLFFILLALVLRNSPDSLILPIVTLLCVGINFIIRVAQKRHEINGGKSFITEK